MTKYCTVSSGGKNSGRRRAGAVRGLLAWTTALLMVGFTAQAPAQTGVGGVPTMNYHAGVIRFYQGEYRDALKIFRDELRGGIKTAQSLWLDSICYHAMIGECLYQVGELEEALEHFTAAVRLYLTFADWMRSVQFQPAIRPWPTPPQTPWGATSRPSKLGRYPTTTAIAMGRIDNNDVFKKGGIVQQAKLMPIEVQEIVRCTVLAIRRRGDLLGPVASCDSLNGQLLTVLQQRPGPANHWSQAWIEVELAAALWAAGKDQEAMPLLLRSQVAGGEFDHPLTSTALLLLGRVALAAGNYEDAARAFLEATYAAYHYPDMGVLEEAFYYAAITQLAGNSKGSFPALMPAAQWAKVKDLRPLRVSLLLSAAEGLAVRQQTRDAGAALEEAALTMGKRPLGVGRQAARLNFLRGLTLIQQGRIGPGDEAVAAAMGYMKRGSLWLFHIAQADGQFLAGQFTPRTAMELYRIVLRDPRPVDWMMDPMESLAVLTTPHGGAMERWFLVAMQRNDHEAALEISDRTRRHRYFSTLGYGGRLLAFRWILEAPNDALDPPSLLQRQDLLSRYPGYQRLSEQAKQVRQKLQAMPLAAPDPQAATEQARLFSELGMLSTSQETILREMAVRREPANQVFPPLKSTKEIQQSLPPGTAVLAFFVAGNELHAFLLTRDKYGDWSMKGSQAVGKRLVSLLREMGHHEPNHEVNLADLANTQWQQTARQLLEGILAGSNADFSKKFPELVIVPDGFLWYVPFEMLQVPVDGGLQSLIGRIRIRYAPTVSLTVADRRGRSPSPDVAIVVGRRDTDTVAETAYEGLAKALPGATILSKPPLPAPSALYKVRMGRLLVFDDLATDTAAPYALAPIQIDRSRTGNTLNDWLALPWGGPETIALPGFHTPAENSLKRMSRTAPGSEVFLSVCAMMSTGAKTLLLSRWRTGGQSSVDLVREFAQELPHTSPADAWQRAVLLAMDSRLNLPAEPRIKRATDTQPPKADHPFFWAGYMLVDSGDRPAPEAEKEAPGKEKEAPGKAKEAPGKEKEAPGRRVPAEPDKDAPPGKDQEAPAEEKPDQPAKAAPPAPAKE